VGRDTDRTLCRLGSVRMLMRGKCDCRPEGQQHAQTRYPFRYRSHDGYPMKAFFESIPKRQTNATREYLARYVLSTFETLMLPVEFESLGTADGWLILFGRTKRSLRAVQLTSVLCLLAARLVVVIGKTRVNTQHDDDHCPQNDQ
jgi:hypothetical protein